MLHHLHHTTDYVTSVHEERLRRGSADISSAMKAAENGDANAWAMLITRFRGHVARVARSYGLDAHQVDDVAQETWLRLYRHIGSVRDPQALGAWLGTTASRESLRALAGDRREEPTDEELGAGIGSADDVTDALASARAQRGPQARAGNAPAAPPRADGVAAGRARALLRRDLQPARDPGREHRPDSPAAA